MSMGGCLMSKEMNRELDGWRDGEADGYVRRQMEKCMDNRIKSEWKDK